MLAFLLGVLLGALLVSLLFLTGRFGVCLSYFLTGAATVGAGYVVALIAGRREVSVAALSLVTGVLLVSVTFFRAALSSYGSMSPSNPPALLVMGIPLVILAVLGGWLAEMYRRHNTRFGGQVGTFMELPTLTLVGIVALVFVVLGAFVFYAGIFRESPSEAAETVFRAANEGDYETANEYLPSGARDILEGDTRTFWGEQSGGGNVEEISTTFEEVDGQRAEVEVFMDYEPGGSLGRVVYMVREDGDWKLAPRYVSQFG